MRTNPCSRIARRVLAPAAALCLLSLAGTAPAHAQGGPFLLSDLIAGTSGTDGLGDIVVDDKKFSNFSYAPGQPGIPEASAVNVQGIAPIPGGDPGIEFTGLWQATPGQGVGSASIGYRVTVLTPGFFIRRVSTDGDPTVTGGDGSASVVESASDTITHTSVLPRILSIFDIATNAGATHTTRLNDQVDTLSLQTALDIQKTISVSADSPTSTARITDIRQFFAQAPPAPEPGSLPLIGGPVLFAVSGVRRQHRTSTTERRAAVCQGANGGYSG